MLAADLDAQGWRNLRSVAHSTLYAKEVALIRLGRMRELTIDDFWALPERFCLRAAHRELHYDENESIFAIRAIVRMLWRPYLPLIMFQSLFRIAVVSQSVLFSKVLLCIEDPSNHAWFEPYMYLAANFGLLLIKSQSGRVSRLLDQEEERVNESIRFEILRLSLSIAGTRSMHTNNVYYFMSSIMRGLRGIFSEISSLVTALFTLWLTYQTIGWIAVIPIVVLISLSLVSLSIEYVKRLCGYSLFNSWVPYVDARDIYSNIKTIKFNCWEQKYLDPALVISDNPDAYSQSRIIDQITQVKANAQSVLSSYRHFADTVRGNLGLESLLSIEPTNGIAVRSAVLEAGPSIDMNDCTFTYWKKTEKNVLSDVTLNIASGQLVSVMGSVASGKTSLLLAMCGEVEMRSGTGQVNGRIGYLEQSPYIMNGTLRENILFGRDFDEGFYWRVIKACALMEDIEQWPKHDMTLIGERGINISGGQKARLALARTVYTQADIYILDDPLSAVDAHVKRHLLDHVLLNTGLLGDKVRVVSMNSDHLLPFAHQNVTIDKGKVAVEILEHPRVHTVSTAEDSSTEGESCDDAMSDGSATTLTADVKPT
ncbi:ATP-binding cassette glutathione S-conjugate transporter ycf1, partial [Linderina macrospora]